MSIRPVVSPVILALVLAAGSPLGVQGCASSGSAPSGGSDGLGNRADDGTGAPQETSTGTPRMMSEARSGTIAITVLDKGGLPIANADVSVGGVSVRANAQGVASFALLPVGRQVFQVRAEGFAPNAQDVAIYAEADTSFSMRLARFTMSRTFESSAGLNFHDGRISLSIPPNAIVDSRKQPVTGPVTLRIAPMDPKDPADLATAPVLTASVPSSMLRGGSGSALQDTPLKSVYMADITLFRGTEELNLAEGSKAFLAFDLPDSGDRWDGETWDRIPSWYFDQKSARWLYEGMGVVKTITTQTSVGPMTTKRWEVHLSHFSRHNADWYPDNCPVPRGHALEDDCTEGGWPSPPPPPPPILRGCVRVKLLGPEGPAPAGVAVTATATTLPRNDLATTATAGEACLDLFWTQGTPNTYAISTSYLRETKTSTIVPQTEGGCGSPSSCSFITMTFGQLD